MQMRATELAASRRPSASPRSSGGAALERREAGQVRSSATAGMKGARTSLFRGRVRVGVRVRARVKVRGKGRVRRRGPTRRLPPKGRRRGRGWRRPSRGHPSAQRCGRTACGMLHGRSMAGREARTLRTTAITTTAITTTVLPPARLEQPCEWPQPQQAAPQAPRAVEGAEARGRPSELVHVERQRRRPRDQRRLNHAG